jgi:uncharacterized protein with HEPN domain
MKSQRVYMDYLQDMLEAGNKAIQFLQNMSLEDFKKDEKTQYAVIRALEIIGEASKKVPLQVKEQFPDISWKAIAGMRDKMVHDYMGINQVVVWKAVVEDLPPLVEQLRNAVHSG